MSTNVCRKDLVDKAQYNAYHIVLQIPHVHSKYGSNQARTVHASCVHERAFSSAFRAGRSQRFEILEHRCWHNLFYGRDTPQHRSTRILKEASDTKLNSKLDDLGSETDGLITSINLTTIAGIQLRNPKILSSVLRQPQQELPQAIEWVASQIPLMHRLFIQPLMASATWGLVTSMRTSLMTSRAMHGERCFSRHAAVLQRPDKRSRKTCRPEIRDRRMAEMKSRLRIVAPSKL